MPKKADNANKGAWKVLARRQQDSRRSVQLLAWYDRPRPRLKRNFRHSNYTTWETPFQLQACVSTPPLSLPLFAVPVTTKERC